MTKEMNDQMDKCSKCQLFQRATLDKNADKMVLTIQCFDGAGDCKGKKWFEWRGEE